MTLQRTTQEPKPLSHSKLVKAAQKWVRSRGYILQLCEFKTNMTQEEPDVIGWKNAGWSVVVECKTSRSDFLVDKKKSFRRNPSLGMGYHRWLFTSVGLLKKEELPESWGLAEVEQRGMQKRVRIVAHPTPHHERALRDENVLLVQACRRAVDGWGRSAFGDEAPASSDVVDGDAGPTASKIIKELRREARDAGDLRQENVRLRTRVLELEGPPQPVVEVDREEMARIFREAI